MVFHPSLTHTGLFVREDENQAHYLEMNSDLDLMRDQNRVSRQKAGELGTGRDIGLRWPVLGQSLPGPHSGERQHWVGQNHAWVTFLTPVFLEL